jgi:hypothetical protein
MKSVDSVITARLTAIGEAVMGLVADQTLSLTEKNRRMQPLVEEKRVLERTQKELQAIAVRDYSGRCTG